MFDTDKPDQNMENNPIHINQTEEMHLDDARTGQGTFSRHACFSSVFIRNRLAVIGFGILLFMFTFAFLGPLISPYGQTQVFKGMDSMSKDYAGADI